MPACGNCNSIRNNLNVVRAYALRCKPASNGMAVGKNAVCPAARHAQRPNPELLAVWKRASIPDRRDVDALPGEPRGWNGKYIRIEAIGMNDLNAFPPDITGKSELA